MRQVLIKQGQALVESVPAPTCEAGTILVRVRRSCVSIGTELSGIASSGRPLWRRAIDQPQRVGQMVQRALSDGIASTWRSVDQRLSATTPTGYSAAGEVLQVGADIEDIRPGDRVACAGAQFAHHADVIRVPRNLVVRVPDEVEWGDAATVTLGAIALQGVRRAEPTIGETFAVIGLGLLGQLTEQMLRSSGCRVLGIDPDARRRSVAQEHGMDASLAEEDRAIEDAARLTDGCGVDGVIITAATASDAVVSLAFRLCRKKGRVVLVGDVGLDIKRADIYEKELDFRVSTSYGPGRYDRSYEEDGHDYPIGYVRWTENRNMAEYVRMLADGRVRLGSIPKEVRAVDDAPQVYAELVRGTGNRPLLVLLDFTQGGEGDVPASTRIQLRARGQDGVVRFGLIGSGAFARATHLPNLAKMSGRAELHSVVSRSGASALGVAREYNARYASTDVDGVFADPTIDAILIATRHDSHADLTRRALKAGKHVFVEKPLALTLAELESLDVELASRGPEGGSIVLTGFNRRFSPHVRQLGEMLKARTGPLMMTYRMNAGFLPADHWTHGSEGGGRNIGEACHIYDLFGALANSPVVSVHASSARSRTGYYRRDDNFVATMTFEDGSVATLLYTALGSRDLPKERLEAFADGAAYVIDDYKELHVHGRRAGGLRTRTAEKGHREELTAFVDAIRTGGQWPISWAEQRQSALIAFAVQRQLEGESGAVDLRQLATG